MPGRTPTEAFQAFIEPIRAAAVTLGQVKITPSAGGQSVPNATHAWSINREKGVVFRGGFRYEAQMHYRIVQRPVSREWKVETLGYRYQLALLGRHLWRIHWHPTTISNYPGPHVHLSLWRPDSLNDDDTLKRHHPTGRMTFEDSLEWLFNEEGVEASRPDYLDVIRESKDLHIQHRSWHSTPPSSVDPSAGP